MMDFSFDHHQQSIKTAITTTNDFSLSSTKQTEKSKMYRGGQRRHNAHNTTRMQRLGGGGGLKLQQSTANQNANISEYIGDQAPSGHQGQKRMSSNSHSREQNRATYNSNGQAAGLKKMLNTQEDVVYPRELRPQILMFKLLASQSYGCPIMIPDTFIFNDPGTASNQIWLAYDYKQKGQIIRKEDFSINDVLEQLLRKDSLLSTVTQQHQQADYNQEIVAVIKTFNERQQGLQIQSQTETQLITRGQLSGLLYDIKERNQCCVIQRYVRVKGNQAYKVRTVYKKENAQFCSFIITNRNQCQPASIVHLIDPQDETKTTVQYIPPQNYLVDLDSPEVSLIKSVPGSNKHTDQTVHNLTALLQYLDEHCNLQFEMLSADFIKQDEMWYMTGINAYKLDLQVMVNKTINLFPFTSNPRDDPKVAEICFIPPQIETQVKQSQQEVFNQNLKIRCNLCELLYFQDKVIRNVPIRMLGTVKAFVNSRARKQIFVNLGEDNEATQFFKENVHPSQSLDRLVEVCKDCYLLFKKAVESLDLCNQLELLVGNHQILPQIDPSPSVICRIFIYFKDLEEDVMSDFMQDVFNRRIEYSLDNQFGSIPVPQNRKGSLDEEETATYLRRPLKALRCHSFSSSTLKEAKERCNSVMNNLSFQIVNQNGELLSQMNFSQVPILKKDQDGGTTQHFKVSSQLKINTQLSTTIYGVIAIDFHAISNEQSISKPLLQPIPDSLIELIDEKEKECNETQKRFSLPIPLLNDPSSGDIRQNPPAAFSHRARNYPSNTQYQQITKPLKGQGEGGATFGGKVRPRSGKVVLTTTTNNNATANKVGARQLLTRPQSGYSRDKNVQTGINTGMLYSSIGGASNGVTHVSRTRMGLQATRPSHQQLKMRQFCSNFNQSQAQLQQVTASFLKGMNGGYGIGAGGSSSDCNQSNTTMSKQMKQRPKSANRRLFKPNIQHNDSISQYLSGQTLGIQQAATRDKPKVLKKALIKTRRLSQEDDMLNQLIKQKLLEQKLHLISTSGGGGQGLAKHRLNYSTQSHQESIDILRPTQLPLPGTHSQQFNIF